MTHKKGVYDKICKKFKKNYISSRRMLMFVASAIDGKTPIHIKFDSYKKNSDHTKGTWG